MIATLGSQLSRLFRWNVYSKAPPSDAADQRLSSAARGTPAGGRRPADFHPQNLPPSLAPLLRPQALGRWLLPQLSAITPQYLEAVLRGALAGNHVQQWQLFDLMFDSWPELAACAQELTYGVSQLKLSFLPFAAEGEAPAKDALERMKLVCSALRQMRPAIGADENDLDGTIADLVDGWFRGVTCLGLDWHTLPAPAKGVAIDARAEAGSLCHSSASTAATLLAPRCTYWVDPVWFAFDQSGRLGLRVDNTGALAPMNLAGTSWQSRTPVVGAFPPHRFLVGIHKAKSGTALGGALLRPLCWWWCAANFSADWLLNLAQLFGLPFRWASYDPSSPQETVDRVCQMLQSMGSNGWAAFPAGTEMHLVEARGGGDHSPQGELLDRADRYARLLLLGQTMSGSQDASKGGGKAFGQVESDVKAQRILAAGQYACRVLNTQLIPSILELNYGDTSDAPTLQLVEDEQGSLADAQRDQVLAQAGLRIGVHYLRAKYAIPEPAPGEETIGGAGPGDGPGKDNPDPLHAGFFRRLFRGGGWNPSEHPQVPKGEKIGDEHGGEFAPKGTPGTSTKPGAASPSHLTSDPLEETAPGNIRITTRGHVPLDEAGRREATALAGALPGTHVTLDGTVDSKKRYGYSGLTVIVDHPLYRKPSVRVLDPQSGVIYNHYLAVKKGEAPEGFGTRVFASQVHAAIKSGKYHHIKAHATGHPGHPKFNGYYTWPRLGYNAPLSMLEISELPRDLRHCRTLLDVMSTEHGRHWWKQNGRAHPVTFDLSENSRSRHVLAAYLKHKQIHL